MRGRQAGSLLSRRPTGLAASSAWLRASEGARLTQRWLHSSAPASQQPPTRSPASALPSAPHAGPHSGPPPGPSPPSPPGQGRRREAGSIFSPARSSASRSSGSSHRLQYNTDPFTALPPTEHYTFPLVTAADLAQSSTRPRAKRMLARDFIHDSLYNPVYGYFSRHAVLLPDGTSREIDFGAVGGEGEFMRLIQSRYSEFEAGIVARQDAKRSREDKMKQRPMARQSSKQGLEEAQRRGRLDLAREMQSEREYGQHADDVDVMVARQVWHTPTELFKPYYARAIARYIVERHRSKTDEAPLVIYELGAGSGALANDVLGYLAEAEPDLYERIEYRIIEISSRLAEQQRKILAKYIDEGTCKVHNESILQWTKVESRECFVIALEVLDNLTHDVVSYSTDSLAPYQAIVSIDESGDMHELWEPVSDPLIRRYLDLVSATPSSLGGSSSSSSSSGGGRSWLESVPQALRKVMTNHLPFYPNLTARTFIPTGSLQLVEVLAKSFPRHNLVVSDFDRLPDAVQGINAPVVQTRLEGTMIPVTTYCVHQGFFDIFFPTDFAMLKRLHSQVTGAASGAGGEIMHHSTFLKRYAETDKTRCRDGSNPLLSWYENASWFLS